MDRINNKLDCLSKFKFRNGLKFKEEDRNYVFDKGIDIVRQYAYDFIMNRLALMCVGVVND